MSFIEAPRVLYKDRLSAFILAVSLVLIMLTWYELIFGELVHSQLAVLHFNIYAGIDILGDWYWIYIIPGIILFFSLLNVFLALIMWRRQRNWSYFLITSLPVLNAIALIYVSNILSYNLR